jgi:AraC-like DNA-binding protein
LGSRLVLVRAAHLNDYIAVLRDIGAPVDRSLARSKLPAEIEQSPELYVSIPVAIEWIAATGRDLPPMALGLLGAQKSSLSSLRPVQRGAIMTAATGMKRLEVLAAIARAENSALDIRIRSAADEVRVICDMAVLGRHPFLCLAEWLSLQAVIAVVRSVAGPSWCPRELCFVSPNQPPDSVHAAFPDTRILVGQPQSSITVPRAVLARSSQDANPSSYLPRPRSGALDDVPDPSGPWTFASLLQEMVQPYLSARSPDVDFAAELAGISTRTLQRRLQRCGTSYSRVVQEARFALARKHLVDPDRKIIDIATMAGYDRPQHFSRAFRRFTGITPSDYRRAPGLPID